MIMTEIKFRTWDAIENRMVRVSRLSWEHPSGLEVNGSNIVGFDESLMQNIGEKDKDENDIWVGDIVKYHNPNYPDNHDEYDVHLKVVRYGSQFLQTNQCYTPDMWYEWDEVEVVGNIYETPELVV